MLLQIEHILVLCGRTRCTDSVIDGCQNIFVYSRDYAPRPHGDAHSLALVPAENRKGHVLVISGELNAANEKFQSNPIQVNVMFRP